MSKSPSKCDICQNNIALYHCPRCGTSTCSLKCCQAHKTATTKDGTLTVLCNGQRDRTKFCSLKGFSDAQLASDYHFLEDVLKISEGSKRLYDGMVSGSSQAGSSKRPKANRVTSSRSTADEMTFITKEVPMHPLLQAKKGKGIVQVMASGIEDDDEVALAGDECKALKICSSPTQEPTVKPNSRKNTKVDPLLRHAELKGINLLRMPPGMQRRLQNTSQYNKKNDKITWKIEIIFHSKDDGSHDKSNFKEADADADQKTKPTKFTVESSLPDSNTLAQELGKHLDVHSGNTSTRSKLRVFSSASRETLLILMKCLPCSSAVPRYYKLDVNETLADVLRGKTIIEYPTVEVVLSEDEHRFPLMISEMS